MKITWQINDADLGKVLAFLARYQDDFFVQERIRVNLSTSKRPVTKAVFWQQLVMCLLTTQQKSGPTSAVSRFLGDSFPLAYDKCRQQSNLAEFARATIRGFRGLRRYNVIAAEVAANLEYLESGGWTHTFERINAMQTADSREQERWTAQFIDDHLKGFGPKQARNLLQSLGLTRFEIPIDSRITKWLNDFGFPIRLTASSLQDRHYYNLISDGIQQLCQGCAIFPCVLDAAIFASYDKGAWTAENVGGRN